MSSSLLENAKKALKSRLFVYTQIKNLTLLVLSTKIEVTYHRYDRKGLEWQEIETHTKLEKKY